MVLKRQLDTVQLLPLPLLKHKQAPDFYWSSCYLSAYPLSP